MNPDQIAHMCLQYRIPQNIANFKIFFKKVDFEKKSADDKKV